MGTMVTIVDASLTACSGGAPIGPKSIGHPDRSNPEASNTMERRISCAVCFAVSLI